VLPENTMPVNTKSDDLVLDVRDLQTHLFLRRGTVKAVDGISFTLRRGEVLGLVGESGCGKSMTALSLMRLLPKESARTVNGQILLEGEDLLDKSEPEMRQIRGRRVSMILQDPQTSLNPVFSIGNQIREVLDRSDNVDAGGFDAQALEALRRVRISAPEQRLRQYPHQLSGGMKQRVVGTIAMNRAPSVLIADEPTTALDPTIQLQYLNLLKELQRTSNMAMLFITHDFGVVAHMCDRVAVMYAGRIVETGPVREIFDRPEHPYTRALIASVPKVNDDTERLYAIEGEPPVPYNLPQGCRFAPRCPLVEDRCREAYPDRLTVGPDHTVDCWRADAA
jgi:oligopeptide/dipeptide ABC transporter ATP-binding protein